MLKVKTLSLYYCKLVVYCSVPSEQFYDELLKNAASYNKRLCQERKMRLPFLDSQTGVGQRHTNLFIPYRYRLPGNIFINTYANECRLYQKNIFLSVIGPTQLYFLSVLLIICLSCIFKVNNKLKHPALLTSLRTDNQGFISVLYKICL